jgi:hypothetical protein
VKGAISYSHPWKLRSDFIVEARARAHVAFDALWREGHMTKAEAYVWLSSMLRLPRAEAHIGRLCAEQCDRLVALAGAKLKKLREATCR